VLITSSAAATLVVALRASSASTLFARRLRYWVVLAALVEVLGYALKTWNMPTMLLYNLYWPLEFGLLLALGTTVAPLHRGWTSALIAVFLLVWVWSIAQLDPRRELASSSIIVGALLQAGLYLYLFWHVAGAWQGRLRDAPAFWLCLAVLLYYGACGPLLGSINYFMRVDMPLALHLYRITQALCVAKFLLMAMACYRLTSPAVIVAHEPAI
jgi:hypothetical protein